MRIALCTDIFLPHMGGIEKAVKSLADSYIEKGHEVMVFTQDMRMSNIDDSQFSYKVARTKSVSLGLGVHSPKPTKDEQFNRAFDEFKPDVVHAHTPFAIGMWAINKAKKAGIPSVLTTHTYLNYMNDSQVPFGKWNPIHRLIVHCLSLPPKKASSECDVLTAVSASVIQQEIRDVYKLDREVLVIRNGCEKVDLNLATENRNYENNKIRLCYAGQIDETKNLSFSFRLCVLLRYNTVPFEFILAGEPNKKFHFPWQKNDKEKYLRYAKENRMEENITFTGRLNFDELINLYSKSDLFLFPSTYDTDGLVVKEANRCGCPALVIKNTGASEQINDNENGFALDDNIDEFLKKIIEVLNLKKKNPKEFLALRERTKNKRIPLWSEIADEYIQVYDDAISKGRD